MKKQLSIFLLIILGFIAGLVKSAEAGEGIYYQFGISIYDSYSNTDRELGSVELGYTWKLDKLTTIDLSINHTSILLHTDYNWGLNQIGVQYRGYIK